ncbi:hypothetical protein [Alicyclobacillus sp. SO9]|uniref:hypothetical protein n=1 Tax=Alicyclobacillus sp. SO9 TaxID=2665646 RepID=UPI0018E8E450|nr:hypothetical protein [Alicyclobacillus sp. SO9]QQE80122.1 hypothetical protein GI364_06715 [Alicyclobacillus sp. SO9]
MTRDSVRHQGWKSRRAKVALGCTRCRLWKSAGLHAMQAVEVKQGPAPSTANVIREKDP